MSKTGEKLIEVIKEDEIHKISSELIETVIDSTLAEGILKDIPFVSTAFGIYNAVTSIQDKLFIKKLLAFLYKLKSVPKEQRVNQIIKIEDDTKYKTKVGEKLLFIINKCDDLDKSSMIGDLFKCYLENKISYDEFLTCVSCIERTPLPELMNFIDSDWDGLDTEGGGSELLAYGLMEIKIAPPKLRIATTSPYDFQDDHAPSNEEILESKMKITNFSVLCYVTHNGSILRKYLRQTR